MNTIDPSTVHRAVVFLVLVVIVALAALVALVARRPSTGQGDHSWGAQPWPTVHLSPDGRFWWDGTDW